MAGKLSIRRVGNILPTLCLVGLLLATTIIIWLCTVGIPDCALRYIENEAAKAGIELHIDKIRLYPRSGLALKAEKIRVRQEQTDAGPAELSIRKVQIAFSLIRLLSGDIRPLDIQVSNGRLILPLSDTIGDALTLNDIDIYTAFFRNSNGISVNLSANFHHINLHVKLGTGDLLEQNSTDSGKEQLSLSKALAEIRPTLQEIKKQLDVQSWSEQSHPDVEINLIHGERWKARLKASIPCYEVEHFHFRDAQLDASINSNTFTINNLKFRTVNPDTQVKLQGGYNWEDRELEFQTSSTAPIIRMLNGYLGESAPQVLQKITTAEGHTPSIELDGSASFSKDFALNNIRLRGKIEQKNMRLGSVPVKQANLSFYTHNGQFSIDVFKLDLNDGYIMADAHAAGETGHAELDLSLPDETLLALIHELTGDSSLTLPTELTFNSNLKLRAKTSLLLPDFEPGKTHLADLVPVLQSCNLQLNCDEICYAGSDIGNSALTVRIDGIDISNETIKAEDISVNARIGNAKHAQVQADTADLLINIKLNNLQWNQQSKLCHLQQADLSICSDSARLAASRINKLQASAEIKDIQFNANEIISTLKSDAISARLQARDLAHEQVSAQGLYLNASIPCGLSLVNTWEYMQKEAHIEAELTELTAPQNFLASQAKLSLKNTADNQAELKFSANIGNENAVLQATATLQQSSLLKLNIAELCLPTAELAPILVDYMPQELKLPGFVSASGDALIDTKNKRLINCHYQVHLPELIRVCHNVHVHKGMEIPLTLQVKGEFSTSEDGSMHYAADVNAQHKLGILDVHVSGNPLKECHITGNNTIPVNIVNALIDNEDAHWIMRDFRCRDGITRNNVTNINTTIRYDKGIFVHVFCDAELINMDFLLGAIRDKEDAQGNPTGEEYLRTDLGRDPYSRVKHGTCGVEVLVQMDCVDNQGKSLPDRININLLNPDVTYDNKPWFKRMGIKNGPATSRITGEAVRFDIENYTISLHKLKGTCYPAYSIGMYYAPLQHFLEDVVLERPADIETEYCIFPLSRKCEVPMKGLIHARAATGAGFRFLGTTISLSNFSGFINISDIDVYLDRMNAQCWGGSLDGSLRINFAGKDTTLDGFFVARNLDLKEIVASYGTEFTSACCNGFIRFQAASPELDAVRAYGQVHLTDGDLMQIGLFRPIGAFLSDVPGNLTRLQETVYIKKEDAPPSWVDKFIRSIFDTGSNAIDMVQSSAYKVPFANHFLRYGIDEAFSRFDIMGGHLITRNMKAKGYNLDVDVQLDIDLDKLTIDGDLWPRISSVPTLIISPITILSDFLIDIDVYGDLISPQWKFGLSKKLKGAASSVTSEPQKQQPLKAE